MVIWETLPNNADWDCFKTPILREILKIRNPLLEEHCAFVEFTRLFLLVMCKEQNLFPTVIDDLDNVDLVPSNVHFSHQEALLYVFEGNEAVITMIINGRRFTKRHVSRTHRVANHWLFDRINLDSKNPNQTQFVTETTRRH